ncbi:DUF5343 domain-containing protein [Bradyrhizobium huanghuaihaiense]|uniref:DUF5343 domain-containing protein n=1 Tax=Bradyrhizobium huanghuaihaiense TaxID=990078 RepID=UPI0021AA2F2A|nr:DUF5343 domain-containing protein [Bradyrhizobium sp. CB3035]UWU75712.1 DUF5343 domain-containing protein [Bradyrhizobium sp. CB3035]
MRTKGTGDRPLIPFLRSLGFIEQSGKPTPEYSKLKGSEEQRRVTIGEGIKKAYQPLFDADEDAHTRTGQELRGLVAQVAGTDEDMTARIANTFAAVAKLGKFVKGPKDDTDKSKEKDNQDNEADEHLTVSKKIKGLRTEFHYNIQVVLPSNATEEVYLNTRVNNLLRSPP